MVATLVASIVARVVDEAVRRGVDPRALAEIVGPREGLTADARVTIDATYRCFDGCLRALDDPAFPIHVARSVSLEDYAVLGFALMTSPSGEVVFERMARYGHIISDSGTWTFAIVGKVVQLTWNRSGPRTVGFRTANECSVAEVAGGIRASFAADVHPIRVHFRHRAPSDTRAHAEHFGVPIRWGSTRDGLDLPVSFLFARPQKGDPAMSRYFAEVLERSERPRATCIDRVRAVLLAGLSSGPPTSTQLARELGMSERSLRRALESEGTTFRAVLDDLRRDAAEDLLRKYSATETAFLLGFSETSALSRAYRRWTGTSMRESASDRRRASARGR